MALIELRDINRSYMVGGEELKVLKGINSAKVHFVLRRYAEVRRVQ